MSSPARPGSDRVARHLVGWGAALTALGLAIVGTAASSLGASLTLAGWAALAYGVHAVGRSKA